jgi:hypothetical protein
MTDRNSLTVHSNTYQLTPRYGPLLCKAVLRSHLTSGAWSEVVRRRISKLLPQEIRLVIGAAGEILHIEDRSADGTQTVLLE